MDIGNPTLHKWNQNILDTNASAYADGVILCLGVKLPPIHQSVQLQAEHSCQLEGFTLLVWQQKINLNQTDQRNEHMNKQYISMIRTTKERP